MPINTVLSVKNFPSHLHKRLEPILANGVFHHGDNLERMGVRSTVGKVCSMRLDKKARVMMAFVLLEGQPTWILLQVLENHNYQDAKALKKGWLVGYLEANTEFLSAQLREALKGKEDNAEEITELEYHNEHWLVLTDEQHKAHHMSYPLFVIGMPGTGKSLLAQSLAMAEIEAVADSNDDDNEAGDFEVAYITKSKALVQQMGINFQALLGADHRIQMIDFASLPQELRPTNDDEKHNYLENCLGWLAKHKMDLNWLDLGCESAKEMHQLLYCEFRIISGCENEDVYYSLGRRQALFGEDERAAVYKAYTQYLKTDLGTSDYSLRRIKPQSSKRYKAIFLDESQDFSDGELADMSELCNGRLVCFVDSNQSLMDAHSKVQAQKRIFNRELSTIVLPYSFRCSQAVTEAANALLHIKQQVMGGVLEKHAETQMKTKADAEVGKAVWIEHKQNQTLLSHEIITLQQSMGSTQRIVITWPEYFAEVKALFPRSLVATPGQVKGLEYDEAYAYHLLDEQHFTTINRLLGTEVPEYQDKGSRAKADRDRRKLGPALNQVFTAFTRARKQLIVIEDSQCHKTKALTARVKQVCTDRDFSTTLASSSTEEWNKQAQKYIKENRLELAKQVCETYLDTNTYQRLLDEYECEKNRAVSSTASTRSVNAAAHECHVTMPASVKPTPVKKQGKKSKQQSNPKKPLSSVADLFSAVRKGDLDAVKKHISNGVSPTAIQGRDYPLDVAAFVGHLHIVRYLFELVAGSEYSTTAGLNTPIQRAAQAGHLEVFSYLHQRSVDLNQNNGDREALIIATVNNQPAIIQYCYEQNIDLNVSTPDGANLLGLAVSLGYVHLAELLITLGYDVNQRAKNGISYLDIAVSGNNLAMVTMLHRCGADLNAISSERTCVLEVAIERRLFDIICFLHQNGVSFNRVFKSKGTPLSVAITYNDKRLVEYMVEHDAYLDDTRRPAFHPLRAAIAFEGSKELIKYLITMGAQVDSLDFAGRTPLHFAVALNRYEEAVCLIRCGANIDHSSLIGETPIFIAAAWGFTNLLKKLIDEGADANKPNIHGARAVHVAKDTFALRLLKKANADFNVMTESGLTPIMGAVILGDLSRLRTLIEYCGANPNVLDREGISPLAKATSLGNRSIIDYLSARQTKVCSTNDVKNPNRFIGQAKDNKGFQNEQNEPVNAGRGSCRSVSLSVRPEEAPLELIIKK